MQDRDGNRISHAAEVPSDPPEYCQHCGRQLVYYATAGGKLVRVQCQCRNLVEHVRSSPDPNVRRLFNPFGR
jgi:hypothetical protein